MQIIRFPHRHSKSGVLGKTPPGGGSRQHSISFPRHDALVNSSSKSRRYEIEISQSLNYPALSSTPTYSDKQNRLPSPTRASDLLSTRKRTVHFSKSQVRATLYINQPCKQCRPTKKITPTNRHICHSDAHTLNSHAKLSKIIRPKKVWTTLDQNPSSVAWRGQRPAWNNSSRITLDNTLLCKQGSVLSRMKTSTSSTPQATHHLSLPNPVMTINGNTNRERPASPHQINKLPQKGIQPRMDYPE